MTNVIFSIDGEEIAETREEFYRYLSRRGVSAVPAVGCYKGAREFAWVMAKPQFDAAIRASVFVVEQESVMLVTSCNKMYATLEYLDSDEGCGNRLEFLGSMHEVSPEEAEASDAWTYRADMDVYWVAKGNPDRGGAVDRYNTYADHAPAMFNALQMIAAGISDPVSIANEALQATKEFDHA